MIATLAALALPALANEEVKEPSIKDLEFLVGEWVGQSTFYYPRRDDREISHETTHTLCQYILKNTYIQCDTSWTRPDGRVRTLRLHLNYNALDEGYQVLYIYDNWPRHVSYLMQYDSVRGVFAGESIFENSEGVSGRERVEWRVSDDGHEVNSAEFSNLETEAPDYWPKYFDFTWQKIDQKSGR